jgi:hypothetical protein
VAETVERFKPTVMLSVPAGYFKHCGQLVACCQRSVTPVIEKRRSADREGRRG